MNETKFRIDCGKGHEIISFHATKPLRMMNPDNRDYITCVKCICANDDAVSSLLIIKKIHIMHK